MKNIKTSKGIIRIVVSMMLATTNCLGQGGVQNQGLNKYKPEYHFYPSIDPTGLFYFNGLYHNNWGTANSKNLIHCWVLRRRFFIK